MKKNIALINEVKNKLIEEQNNLIEKSFSNISSILDIENAMNWCNENKVHSVIIFGSRTRLHETENSDLDIMITDCDTLNDFNNDNYLEKQKELVDTLYKSFFHKVVKNKNIELDFKLNVNRFYEEGYNGIDANTIGISEDNDFYFCYQDIPSYFEIEKDKICFRIAEGLNIEDVFDENSFLEVEM